MGIQGDTNFEYVNGLALAEEAVNRCKYSACKIRGNDLSGLQAVTGD
jgi:hypothetical protein